MLRFPLLYEPLFSVKGERKFMPIPYKLLRGFFLILPIDVAGRSQVGTSTNNKSRAETLERDDGGKKLRPIQ